MPPQILPVPSPMHSYWLSQPSQYAQLRSTPSLPSMCDIVIIGSGLSGILTAYQILQNTANSTTSENVPDITILEARDLCSGATARNGGHVKVKTATLINMAGDEADEFQAFVAKNQEYIREIVEREGIACEMEVRRSFDVFIDEDEAREVKSKYTQRQAQGIKWTQKYTIVPPDFVEKVTSIKGAKLAFSVPVLSLWPYKFATGLLKKMLEKYPNHLNVQTNTPVTALSTIPNGTTLITPRGQITTPKLVLATNAYTAGLLPNFTSTITPILGMATHITPSTPVYPHLNNTYNLHFHTNTDYLNPRPDGSIVVGGGGHLYRSNRSLWYNTFDDSTPWPHEIAGYWENYMGRSFHGWGDCGEVPECTWAGVMGVTEDGRPHVGRVKGMDGDGGGKMWVLAGFNGGGNALIPLCARAVAEMVIRGVGFEHVAFGIPKGFGTSEERMKSSAL